MSSVKDLTSDRQLERTDLYCRIWNIMFAFVFCGTLLASSRATSKPSIVVIYADDLGYGDVQCYNEERGLIPTPHIDSLAAQGMRFTDAHSSSAVCSPSRYTLLTGRYHWRTRLQKGIVGLWGKPLIREGRTTLGHLGQEAGYRTVCIGKWHLGWNWPISADEMEYFRTGGYGGKKDIQATNEHRSVWKRVFSQSLGGGPTAVGFDRYFGVDVPNWPPYTFIENDRVVGLPTEFADPSLFTPNQASVQGPALEGWSLEPVLPALGDEAVEVIEASAREQRPLLMYLSLTSPHTPLAVNDEWKGKSGLGSYADLVIETDALVGKILAALERTGKDKDTLVLFTSDNGCAHYIGTDALEKQGHYPSGPLRGYKSDVWEGGHRVPFIVRWPGVVKAGSVFDGLVHQADVFATVAEITGIGLSDRAMPGGEDSFSLLSCLKGGRGPVRTSAISCSIRGVPSLRLGDWKYIPQGGSGGWSKGEESQDAQLYHLGFDLGERMNLAAEYPKKLTELRELMESLIARGRSNPGPKVDNDVQVVRY